VSWVRVPLSAVPAAWKLSKIGEPCQDQSCLFWTGDNRNKGQNPEYLSCVRVPVKMICVVQKLSTIKEQRQDHSSLCQQGDCRNKGHNPEKLSWVRVTVKTNALGFRNYIFLRYSTIGLHVTWSGPNLFLVLDMCINIVSCFFLHCLMCSSYLPFSSPHVLSLLVAVAVPVPVAFAVFCKSSFMCTTLS
jgi:hypothetical protein